MNPTDPWTSPSEYAEVAPPCAFIDDGYSRQCVIPADNRYHPQMTMMFRPVTQSQRVLYYARIAKLAKSEREEDLEKAELYSGELMAKHVLEWDLQDRERNTVAITSENFQKVEPNLQAKIFKIVMGELAPPPRETDEEDTVKNSLTE